MEDLWQAFLDLSNARVIGDLPQPISYEAIGAYSDHIFPLTVWEKRLIRRIDIAVVKVITDRAVPSQQTIPFRAHARGNDASGIRSVLRAAAKGKGKGGA